ncbi:hypothetical protein [Planctomycetes bacterium Pla163]|uniref:hypothetical protein n=1 Tax=Rohdeia mirabilis TaxID=2528008 RepID=UPI0011AAF6D2
MRTTTPAPPVDPLDWVAPDAHLVLWSLWPDVRELVGASAFDAHTAGWLEAEARADISGIDLGNDYVGEFVIAGVARLGLVPDAIEAVFVDAGIAPDRSGLESRLEPHWRVQFARFARAHPQRAREELEAAWTRAVAANDLELVAACIELARGEVVGYDPFVFEGPTGHMDQADRARVDGASDSAAPLGAGDDHTPSSLWSDEACRDTCRDLVWFVTGRGGDTSGVLDLLERYGVPADVDLAELARITRERRDELADAVIPLPHPYDLELAVLRYERLLARLP